MESCSASFSGGDVEVAVDIAAAADAEVTVECENELPAKSYNTGDKITAGNGITVEVSETIEPDDGEFSIACFNFYLQDQKINDEYVCLKNTVLDDTPLECATYLFQSDYGVAVNIKFMKGDELSLDVFPTTSGDIYTPLDLFSECINKNYDDICTKHLKDTPMDGEETLQKGGLKTFFPSDSPEIGDYLIKQLEACRGTANEILSPVKTILNNASIRYYLGEPGLAAIEPAGRFMGADYVVVYDEHHSIGDILAAMDPADIDNETCRDFVILHELCHGGCWTAGGGDDPYFKLTLQEGLCKFIDRNYTIPASLTLNIETDLLLHEAEQFTLEGFGGTEVFEVKELAADHVTFSLSYITQEGDVFSEGDLVIEAQSVESIMGYTGNASHLIVDQPFINGDDSSARVRVAIFQGTETATESLACGEDSFSVGFIYWIDDKPYKNNNTSGPNESYYSLDQTVEYYTGACFFDGIRQMYQADGKDFENFLPGLIASIRQYDSLPLKDQHEQEFCILDGMQSVVDKDIGTGKYAIKEYAKKFGYDENSPWCTRLFIHQGNTHLKGAL